LRAKGQDNTDALMMHSALNELQQQNADLEAHAAEMTAAVEESQTHVQLLQQSLEEKNHEFASNVASHNVSTQQNEQVTWLTLLTAHLAHFADCSFLILLTAHLAWLTLLTAHLSLC
jgi:chromosome segregation ATPase